MLNTAVGLYFYQLGPWCLSSTVTLVHPPSRLTSSARRGSLHVVWQMNSCPQCKLINPSDAVLCDCGYDFSTGKGGLKQRMFLFRPRVARNIGVALFVLSFVTPGSWKAGSDFSVCGGVVAFLFTPFLAFKNIQMDVGNWSRILITVTFLLSWSANFTIFFKLPWVAALIAILLPWCIFISMPRFAGFFPFYPWAFGIAIIHLSRFVERTQTNYPRTS